MLSKEPRVSNLHQLLDYYSRKFSAAEIHLANTLPRWIGQVSSIKLKVVLQKYLELVREHVSLCEGFISGENISSVETVNPVMQALIREAEDNAIHCLDPEVRDACLLASIQEINHFKISAYGTAASFATALGMEVAARAFNEAKVNERQIDDRLSQLAEHEINIKAQTPIVLPNR